MLIMAQGTGFMQLNNRSIRVNLAIHKYRQGQCPCCEKAWVNPEV